MPDVSIFGKDPRICLIGPSSCRRTWEIGTIVSSASSRAERAAAVYMTHPYLWNRSPAWVTTWSRGIGPSTATLRLDRAFTSFTTNTSGAASAGSPTLRLQPTSDGLAALGGCLSHRAGLV